MRKVQIHLVVHYSYTVNKTIRINLLIIRDNTSIAITKYLLIYSKVVLITNLKKSNKLYSFKKKVLLLSTLFVSRIIWQDLKFFKNVGRSLCFLLTIMLIILSPYHNLLIVGIKSTLFIYQYL